MICISATPADYELDKAGLVAEQIVRPTGLLDPRDNSAAGAASGRRPAGQHKAGNGKGLPRAGDNAYKEKWRSSTEYLQNEGVRVRYMHSEIHLERMEIIRDLRLGEFDVLVGINLLREGLDLPEVSLVAILDADKEGFLRSERSLIQTIGQGGAQRRGQGCALCRYRNGVHGKRP